MKIQEDYRAQRISLAEMREKVAKLSAINARRRVMIEATTKKGSEATTKKESEDELNVANRSALMRIQEDFRAQRISHADMREKVAQLSIQMSQLRHVQRSKPALHHKGRVVTITSLEADALARVAAQFVWLQASVRRKLARRRLMRVLQMAGDRLLAVPGTVAGSTGWYEYIGAVDANHPHGRNLVVKYVVKVVKPENDDPAGAPCADEESRGLGLPEDVFEVHPGDVAADREDDEDEDDEDDEDKGGVAGGTSSRSAAEPAAEPAAASAGGQEIHWVLLKGPVLRRVYNEAVQVSGLLIEVVLWIQCAAVNPVCSTGALMTCNTSRRVQEDEVSCSPPPLPT
jgi:hypothetical protein